MIEKEMHWLYLLFGGFILGILSLVLVYSIYWLLKGFGATEMGVLHPMRNFVKKAWGYW